MSNLILPARFTSQPQYPAPIDWSNQITRGMTQVYTPSYGLSNPGRIKGGWNRTGTQTIGAGTAGLGITNTVSGVRNDITSTEESQGLIGTAEASVLIFFKKTDTTNRAGALFSPSEASLGGAERFNAHAPFSDGTTYFDFGGSSGNNRISIASLDYSKPTAIMFAGALNGLRIVQDGIQRASSSVAVTRTQLAGKFTVNHFLSASTCDLLQVYLVVIFNRDVPLAECISLTRNPWQIYKMPARRFWPQGVLVVGGFKAGWAVNANQIIGGIYA